MEGFAGTGGGSDVEFEFVAASAGEDVGFDEGIDEVAGKDDRAACNLVYDGGRVRPRWRMKGT